MLNANGERELAYIVKVDAIYPLPGYDRVESAAVGGWRVVVKKGQFQPGDYAIYFEIDSKVPAQEPFMFLEPKKFKVKTQKMCKSISQGLLMAVEDFTALEDAPAWAIGMADRIAAGKDVDHEGLTEVIGVTYAVEEDNKRKAASIDKYKKMAQRRPNIFKKRWAKWMMRREWGKKVMFFFFGKKKDKATGFPTHFPYIKRSDEERIENMVWILEDKSPWIETVKIDGTSCTYILERKKRNKFEYYVLSRNVRQLTPEQKSYHADNVYWEIEYKYHIKNFLEDMLKIHPDWNYVAIQGEGAGVSSSGAKIQEDPHKFGELRFFAYNFIDPIKGRWNSIEAKNLVKNYGIEWVPITCENYILPDDIEEFKLHADGLCEAQGASGAREGFVYRDLEGKRSFKNVSRKYLLKDN